MSPLTTVFPNWARAALGLLVAFLGFLVAGGTIHNEELRGVLSTGLTIIASAGIVPPRASDLKMSPAVALALTTLAAAASYLVTAVVSLDPTLRGIVIAAIALLTTVGIRPPQLPDVTRAPIAPA